MKPRNFSLFATLFVTIATTALRGAPVGFKGEATLTLRPDPTNPTLTFDANVFDNELIFIIADRSNTPVKIMNIYDPILTPLDKNPTALVDKPLEISDTNPCKGTTLQPAGFLGGGVSGQSRKRGKTEQREDSSGQSMAAANFVRSSVGGFAHQELLFPGTLPTSGTRARKKPRLDRRRPQPARYGLLVHRSRPTYRDLGLDYLHRLHKHHLEKTLVKRLEKLGHRVILEPPGQAA